MSKKSYGELLKDPRWQRKRLEILQAADFKCRGCGSAEKTLHVHHKLYRKGAMPWEYENHELKALCEDCHTIDHLWRERLNEALSMLDDEAFEMVVGFAEAEAAKIEQVEDMPIRSYGHGIGIGIAFGVTFPALDQLVQSRRRWTQDEIRELASTIKATN